MDIEKDTGTKLEHMHSLYQARIDSLTKKMDVAEKSNKKAIDILKSRIDGGCQQARPTGGGGGVKGIHPSHIHGPGYLR